MEKFIFVLKKTTQKHFYRGKEETYIIGMEYADKIRKFEIYPISYKKFLQMWKQSK